jgi:hypothetical protein
VEIKGVVVDVGVLGRLLALQESQGRTNQMSVAHADTLGGPVFACGARKGASEQRTIQAHPRAKQTATTPAAQTRPRACPPFPSDSPGSPSSGARNDETTNVRAAKVAETEKVAGKRRRDRVKRVTGMEAATSNRQETRNGSSSLPVPFCRSAACAPRRAARTRCCWLSRPAAASEETTIRARC